MRGGLLARASGRFHRRHPWQTLLILLGIALGVAVVVAVDLANESARRAFDLSLEAVAGGASHRIYGGPGGIPEEVFTRLRRERGVHASAPVIVDRVELAGRGFTLLGVDPVSEIALDRHVIGMAPGGNLGSLLAGDALWLSEAAAAELELAPGDPLSLRHGGRDLRATLGGTFAARGAEELIIADIAVAQALLDRPGVLDRIDLNPGEARARRLADWLPPPLRLVSAGERDRSLRAMTDTFHLNLTAMSLLALLVGGLLIHNTVTFTVLRRRETWGLYRALGVTPGQVRTLVVGEALVLALAGTALGLVLGIALSQSLVDLVLRTIDDLYFQLTVSEFTLSPLSLAKGIALGLGVTLVSVLAPMRTAGRTPPALVMRRSGLERRSRGLARWLFAAGLALLVAGGWLVTRELGLAGGFVALALIVTGICAMVPALLHLAIRLLLRLAGDRVGILPRLALRGIDAGLSRTGLAVAALTVAVAATVGMGIMIDSFRHSLETWLAQTLRGDLYVTLEGFSARQPGPGLSPDWIAQLRALDGVAAVERHRVVTVETEQGPLQLLAGDVLGGNAAAPSIVDEQLLARDGGSAGLSRFSQGEGILISEPLAHHRDLGVGDRITFVTARGETPLPVLGVFTDYRSTRGLAMMHLDLYQRLWRDRGISGLALYGDGSVPVASLLNQVRRGAEARPRRIQVQSSAEIRGRSLAIFEQTFAVTRVLRLVTVLVAFVGVLGALMLLQLERMRELAILRATGMTARQVGALVLGQTGLMGLLAGLLALPLGLVMAWVLIHVINLRAFGWTLGWTLDPGILLEALTLSLVAALLAGLWPAWRAGRVAPAEVLRDE